MNNATKWGLGIGVALGALVLWSTRSRAGESAPPPAPPRPANLGALAQVGDTAQVPTGLLFNSLPFAVPNHVNLQPNERVDALYVRITSASPDGLQGYVNGFSWIGPSRAGSTTIPEQIQTARFSRAGVVGLTRNGQRIG